MPTRPAAPLLLAVLLAASAFTAPEYTIGPRPDWVISRGNVLDDPHNHCSPNSATCYLVSDIQVNTVTHHYFYHIAYRIMTAAGLEDETKLTITYAPSYERVILHQLRIVRPGATIDLLGRARVRAIQQEEDLVRNIYDGRKSLILFLDGLTVGDIVEYSYSQVGDNPIFEGAFTDAVDTKWDSPVAVAYYRLLAGRDRPTRYRGIRTDAAPRVREIPPYTEYEWADTNVQPLYWEGETPDWFNPYPFVQISQYDSWVDVRAWAQKQYPFEEGNSLANRPDIARLLSSSTSRRDTARALVRYVQDNIRYLGIEMGVYSHKPHSPLETLERKYGDCKDKTYLLCSLLRACNIHASPVLVSTRLKHALAERLPSPMVFNHVIARIVTDSVEFFVDPTLSHQGGTLENTFLPEYGMGLIVDKRVDNLTRLPFKPEQTALNVAETLRVTDLDSTADYVVHSRHTGERADDIRRYFAETDREHILRNYLNYYARLFPDIYSADSVRYRDDTETNVVEVTERYRIKDLWGAEGENDNYAVRIDFYSRNNTITKPDTRIRRHPFEIPYPCNITQATTLLLPERFPVTFDTVTVDNAYLTFTESVRSRKKVVDLRWSLVTKADAGDPDSLPMYSRALDDIDENSAYQLYESKSRHRGEQWLRRHARAIALLAVAGLVALAGAVAGSLALMFWLRRRVPATAGTSGEPPMTAGRG